MDRPRIVAVLTGLVSILVSVIYLAFVVFFDQNPLLPPSAVQRDDVAVIGEGAVEAVPQFAAGQP